jgi:hypothetical protein
VINMRRSLISFGLAALLVLIWPATGLAAILVPLGTAGNYAVLAHTTITGDPPSSWISGQMGIDAPASAITGFPPSTSGHIDAANPAAVQAKSDLTTAYLNAAGQTPCTPEGPALDGLILVAGIYCGGTMGLTGTLTLSGGGVYIFQIASTLITGAGARVSLINGAQPCDIFWQVGSSATIGAATAFVGNIMALTDINMNAGATLNGRALARNGEVTLINNRIIQAAGCGFSAPAFVAAPAGNTLPATLAPSSPILPGPTGIPEEMRGEFPFLLLLALGAGIGATALGISSRRRRRRNA